MIVGEKATLLPFDESYLAQVHAWINHEDVRWGTGAERPVSDFEHRQWYEKTMSDPSQRIFIVGRGGGAEAIPVGVIGLRHLDMRTRAAEYWMYLGDSKARGQGVAHSASELLLSFGFGTLGLNRVYLVVNENNDAAIALYRRLGFVQEGVCREACFQQGRFIDRLLFSMLAAEFRGCQTRIAVAVEA